MGMKRDEDEGSQGQTVSHLLRTKERTAGRKEQERRNRFFSSGPLCFLSQV